MTRPWSARPSPWSCGYDDIEAIYVARRYRPDVILMDIRMPKMDGLEATLRILEIVAPSITRRLIGQFTQRRTVDGAVARRLDHLTDREREVVVAVARGPSNAEIAEERFIGAATGQVARVQHPGQDRLA